MSNEDDFPVGFIGAMALLGLGLGGAALAMSAKRSRALQAGKEASIESFTENDIEAIARMFASENPHASRQLHIEQAWTQIRARKRGQSIYDRITGGAGFGSQEEHDKQGRALRPVATTLPATDEFRQLAREILSGQAESVMPGARTFFEPDQQDKAFAIGERAREKRSRGEKLSDQEQRLIRYISDSAGIRRRWISQGHEFVDSLDGVEFYT